MVPEFNDRPGRTDNIAYLLQVSGSLLVTLFASFGAVGVGIFLMYSLPDSNLPANRYDRILESRLNTGENLIAAGLGGGLASTVPFAVGGLQRRRREGSNNDTINIEQSGETTIVAPDLEVRPPASQHEDYEGEY